MHRKANTASAMRFDQIRGDANSRQSTTQIADVATKCLAVESTVVMAAHGPQQLSDGRPARKTIRPPGSL
jgi:hypothetical protein